jgi:hypothetical protein
VTCAGAAGWQAGVGTPFSTWGDPWPSGPASATGPAWAVPLYGAGDDVLRVTVHPVPMSVSAASAQISEPNLMYDFIFKPLLSVVAARLHAGAWFQFLVSFYHI